LFRIHDTSETNIIEVGFELEVNKKLKGLEARMNKKIGRLLVKENRKV